MTGLHAERKWIEREGRLQLLNFVDPFLFGLRPLHFGESNGGIDATASVSHVLTSFGHTIDVQMLGKRNGYSGSAILHLYKNGARTFPGLEVTTFDLPAAIVNRPFRVAPRAMLWLQPSNQAFDTRRASGGGAIAVRVEPERIRARTFFLEIEGKTAGWMMASPYLGASVGVRTGIVVPTR